MLVLQVGHFVWVEKAASSHYCMVFVAAAGMLAEPMKYAHAFLTM